MALLLGCITRNFMWWDLVHDVVIELVSRSVHQRDYPIFGGVDRCLSHFQTVSAVWLRFQFAVIDHVDVWVQTLSRMQDLSLGRLHRVQLHFVYLIFHVLLLESWLRSWNDATTDLSSGHDRSKRVQVVAALWYALIFLQEGIPVRICSRQVKLTVSPLLIILHRIRIAVLIISDATLFHRNMGVPLLKQACQDDILVICGLQATLGGFWCSMRMYTSLFE